MPVNVCPADDLTALMAGAADQLDREGWTARRPYRATTGPLTISDALHLTGSDTVLEVIRVVRNHRGHTTVWEREPGRTAAEVTASLRTPVTVTELETILGPQWRELVALVRQVAQVTYPRTEAQLQQILAETPEWEVGLVAWSEAIHACDQVADNRQSDAWVHSALAAAATWSAVTRIATNAGLALAARDRIGEVFTQTHYDTLTRGWAGRFGRVHPDDPAVLL